MTPSTAEPCADCEHIHTPEGCAGPPSPSDVWAGVSPVVCDCGVWDQETEPAAEACAHRYPEAASRWSATSAHRSPLLAVRQAGVPMTAAPEFTKFLNLCNECNGYVLEDDAGPSCGAHILHIECGPWFGCNHCYLVRAEIP